MQDKKKISETRVFPVLFMIIVTIVSIGILATIYQVTINKVNTYRQMKLRVSILQLFNLPVDNIDLTYDNYIKKIDSDKLQYYIAESDSIVLGYCFPVSGRGLWGTINALLVLTPDLTKIKGLEIVNQNETPGLGGRITEDWFKKQFQNKVIISNKIVRSFQLVPESEKTHDDQINQITGATASSKAIVDMLHDNVETIRQVLKL